jgi:glycine/D-amino acid oxidase-like deaminating enzyme
VAGWVPQADGLYVIVAHAAVTLAPALGELAASEIADLRDDPLLERFRPGRFSPTYSSASPSGGPMTGRTT